VPATPVHALRDLWPGDVGKGAEIARDIFRFEGKDYRLPGYGAESWETFDAPMPVRRWMQGFVWLRDLRALGSDEARLRARAIVGSWLDHPPTDPLINDAPTTGARLWAWIGHYDFFAASADETFRQRLMDRILVEGRTIAALLPLSVQGWRGLTALKGLLAAAIAIPTQSGFMSRFHRYLEPELERLLLPDGSLAERSPEAQLQAARELCEMQAMLRMAHLPPAPPIAAALARIGPVLRALRHGDGGLSVFNGASEHDGALVDMILQQGARQRLLAPAMPDGGFIRVAAGRSLLLVDSGMPAPLGHDRAAHGGTLSFEFSHARHRIFVNCGHAEVGAWERALRATAAHTALCLDDRSCIDIARDGTLSRRPAHVTATQQAQDGATWLDLFHDGYRASLGARWQRRLYIDAQGSDLRGQEIVEGERPVAMALRFHVHPDVDAQISPECDEVLLHVGGMIWRFRHEGGQLSLEDSIYAARGRRERTVQIVVTVPMPRVKEEAGVDSVTAQGDVDDATADNDAKTPEVVEAAQAQSVEDAISQVPTDDAPRTASSETPETVNRSPVHAALFAKEGGATSASSSAGEARGQVAKPSKDKPSWRRTVLWALERVPE